MPETQHAPLPTPLPARIKDDPQPRRLSPEPQVRSLRSTVVPEDATKPKDKVSDKEKPAESKVPAPSESTPKVPAVEPEPEEDEENPAIDLIDEDTFNQLLELDEDEETHDFSRPMVWDYFEQAVKTFGEMDEAFAAKDLKRLSSLGHFLKGSSAALGLSRVKNTCEMIQNTGNCRDERAEKDLTPEAALKRSEKLLKRVKVEYGEAEAYLKKFYGEDDA